MHRVVSEFSRASIEAMCDPHFVHTDPLLEPERIFLGGVLCEGAQRPPVHSPLAVFSVTGHLESIEFIAPLNAECIEGFLSCVRAPQDLQYALHNELRALFHSAAGHESAALCAHAAEFYMCLRQLILMRISNSVGMINAAVRIAVYHLLDLAVCQDEGALALVCLFAKNMRSLLVHPGTSLIIPRYAQRICTGERILLDMIYGALDSELVFLMWPTARPEQAAVHEMDTPERIQLWRRAFAFALKLVHSYTTTGCPDMHIVDTDARIIRLLEREGVLRAMGPDYPNYRTLTMFDADVHHIAEVLRSFEPLTRASQLHHHKAHCDLAMAPSLAFRPVADDETLGKLMRSCPLILLSNPGDIGDEVVDRFASQCAWVMDKLEASLAPNVPKNIYCDAESPLPVLVLRRAHMRTVHELATILRELFRMGETGTMRLSAHQRGTDAQLPVGLLIEYDPLFKSRTTQLLARLFCTQQPNSPKCQRHVVQVDVLKYTRVDTAGASVHARLVIAAAINPRGLRGAISDLCASDDPRVATRAIADPLPANTLRLETPGDALEYVRKVGARVQQSFAVRFGDLLTRQKRGATDQIIDDLYYLLYLTTGTVYVLLEQEEAHFALSVLFAGIVPPRVLVKTNI